MSNKKFSGISVGVACILFSAVSFICGAQELSGDQVLTNAKKWYAAGRYDSTVAVIRLYLKNNGKDPSAQQLVPLLIEGAVRTKEYTLVTRLLPLYITKYPSSPFLPRVYYCQGLVCAAAKADGAGALVAFSNAAQRGVTTPVDSMIRVNIAALVDNGKLTKNIVDSLKSVAPGVLTSKVAEYCDYRVALRIYASGSNNEFRTVVDRFFSTYKNSIYTAELKALAFAPQDEFAVQSQKPLNPVPTVMSDGIIRIGLLAPQSGVNADLGKKIEQGVALALTEHAKLSSLKITVVSCDTKSDLVVTARTMTDLISRQHVPVIIGPVLSEEAVVASSILMNNPAAVLITPTATDDGIASLAPTVFQMNVTLDVLGAKVAQYATENLSIKDFVIVSPLSKYGTLLAESFKKTVLANGGQIIAEDYFNEGMEDFSQLMRGIKFKVAQARWEKMALSHGTSYKRVAREDSSYVNDSTVAIGGFFIPGEAEDAAKIAAYVNFARIKTQLLGSTGWHVPKLISSGKSYVQNALFSSNFQPDSKGAAWGAFASAFKERYKEEPDRVAALGYDAANLVCKVLRENGGVARPDSVAAGLGRVREYDGATGMISLDPKLRLNTQALIFKIKDNAFVRVQ